MESKRTTTKEIIAYLAEKFPACFSVEGPAKPLKVGIFQDLATALEGDETVSKTRLRQALRHYTSSWRYLKSVKAGIHRIDIEGAEGDVIDQAQADYAAQQLKESKDKFANKLTQDKSDQKAYKGDKPSKTGTSKPQPKAAKKAHASTKHIKSNKAKGADSKPLVKLKKVESSTLVAGMLVKVKLGNAPMDGTITEVSGKEVAVQLSSGMVVRTQSENIYTA
jgi:ProP effector